MVVVATPFSGPARSKDRSGRDPPDGAAQVLAIYAGWLPTADPLNRLICFRVDGTGKHRLSSETTSADPQFDDHAIGLGVLELKHCLRDDAGEVCDIEPVRCRLGPTA